MRCNHASPEVIPRPAALVPIALFFLRFLLDGVENRVLAWAARVALEPRFATGTGSSAVKLQVPGSDRGQEQSGLPCVMREGDRSDRRSLDAPAAPSLMNCGARDHARDKQQGGDPEWQLVRRERGGRAAARRADARRPRDARVAGRREPARRAVGRRPRAVVDARQRQPRSCSGGGEPCSPRGLLQGRLFGPRPEQSGRGFLFAPSCLLLQLQEPPPNRKEVAIRGTHHD